jgi:hypothetical protein
MRDRERKIAHEAFRAGWQAALAVKITDPRVLAVIESCFDQWLEEAADEVDVLGLLFRRRHDLPQSLPGSASAYGEPYPKSDRPRVGNGVRVEVREDARAREQLAADLRALAGHISHPRRTATSNGQG